MTQSTSLIVKHDDKRKFRDILFRNKKSVSPAIPTAETTVDTQEAEIEKENLLKGIIYRDYYYKIYKKDQSMSPSYYLY